MLLFMICHNVWESVNYLTQCSLLESLIILLSLFQSLDYQNMSFINYDIICIHFIHKSNHTSVHFIIYCLDQRWLYASRT